ncbi:alpha-amylase [Flammeovirga yaeyamensis]|nr:alpha-amylase [Flammeovirga yaeyamensis]
MKMKTTRLGLLSALLIGSFSCTQVFEEDENSIPAHEPKANMEMQVTTHDGAPFTTDESSNKRYYDSPGGPVMMQAFYWDVPAGGTWWNTVKGKLNNWSNQGIGSIWLPPASKAQNGPFSMGYDPMDYFDFGDYNQNGSTETRFGSGAELRSLIGEAHNQNMQVYADIVINHNSGGQLEANPYTGTDTWTKFQPASGKFNRTYNDFHPNLDANNDEGIFGGYPDLSHVKGYVQDWLWKSNESVGKYYKNNVGFDGWRFDYVKGFGGWVVKDWVNHVGGFAVGEMWDGNANTLKWWVDNTDRKASAFDFAAYYAMDRAFDGNNLNELNSDMLWKKDSYRAVTFVANHDTDEIWRKNLAYAYILTHEGYPCVFYKDYEDWLDRGMMDNLLWIHKSYATGNTSILHVDNDEYIMRRNGYNGNPGLVLYINNSDNWQERWIPTNWSSQQIKDYTGHSNWEPWTQGGTWVKIQCPPRSYSIWSTK